MWNLWYVVIGLAVAFVVCLSVYIIFSIKEYDINEKLKQKYNEYMNNISNKTFKQECEKTKEELVNCGAYQALSGVILVISSFLLVLFLLISIIGHCIVKKEYIDFIETRIMIEQVYDIDMSLENVGLNNQIIETNKWLTEAKASIKHYGNWSAYIGLGIENLEYITLKKE